MPIERSDIIRGTILAVFAACIVFANPLSAQDVKESIPIKYLLGSGDKLRISFFGKHYSDLSGDYEIDGAGIVQLPLVENILLGGKTLSEAENVIKAPTSRITSKIRGLVFRSSIIARFIFGDRLTRLGVIPM